MSPNSPQRETSKPLWVNVAAVGGLLVFLTAGFLTLRQLSQHRSRPADTPDTTKAPPALDRDDEPVMHLIRPGERSGNIVFEDLDVTDPEAFRLQIESNPKAAAAAVARLEDSPERDELLYDLMQIWVEKDPAQAADWTAQLPVGMLKNDATTELALAWAALDPESASAWVEENIFTENAPAGASSVASTWAKVDIEAASDWVASLDPDAPARANAMNALAFQLGASAPQRGLAWISRLKPEDRNLIAVNFAASWANDAPRAAANWLRFQASGVDARIRDQATLAVINSWASNEVAAASASKWIDDLPDGQLKERSKATFAESHAETSPREAAPWARDIKDPERRLEVTMVVFEQWAEQDMEGFKAGLSESWGDYDEPLRHEIYALLMDYDPGFKGELFKAFEDSRADNGNGGTE